MQLLTISIYNATGERRDVNFSPGQLNIITGESSTGKSALLTIVDYCLGRDTPTVPRTDVFSVITWYAVLWQFDDGGRAVTARRPQVGKSNSRAGLILGGPDLRMPEHAELRENVDSDSLRERLGARIGLSDVVLEPHEYSTRGAGTVSLGTAALFCLQEQEEIDSKSTLFHRQSEDGIKLALRDTFPFYLGAVDGDQANKRAELREAKRALRRADRDLAVAEAEFADRDAGLLALLGEARAVGLLPDARLADSADYLAAARSIVYQTGRPAAETLEEDRAIDLRAQDERRALESRQADLRAELERAVATRDLLLDQRTGETEYAGSLQVQVERMSSLGLLSDHDGDAATCPVCSQQLEHPDATVGQMVGRLESLRSSLASVQQAQPRRREAVAALNKRVQRIRGDLGQIGEVISVAARTRGETAPGDVESRQAFVRGRIDAILDHTAALDPNRMAELRRILTEAELRVSSLEIDLSDDDVREQTISRLNVIASYLSEYAQRLDIEGADRPVRLDISDLTVVVDEESGPVPLANLGSGQNWVGYHIAAHLALHRFFVNQSRPVPRFLMLDQPSQAHFQSDPTLTGVDGTDPETEYVRELYHLIADYAEAHAGSLQVIVVDHARFSDDWFQSKIVHDWHGGEKLIPASWLVS